MRRAALLLLLMIAMSGSLAAQVPTGAIAGTVTDQVGAVLRFGLERPGVRGVWPRPGASVAKMGSRR